MSNLIKKRKVVKGGTFGYEEKNKTKLCRDLADIFEGLHGDKIEIDTRKGYGNNISEYNNQFTINVQKTPTRSTKTSLEDSLSHILTKSAKKAFEKKKNEMYDNFVESRHRNKIDIMTSTIFTAFENKRAESWSAAIYQGYKERVTEANRLDGENLIKEIKNPVEALNAARLGLTEMVANSEFPEANDFIKSVERTMPKASVLLTNDYIQRVLKPWYQKIIQDDDDPENPENQEGDEEEQEQGEGEEGGEEQEQGEGEGQGEGQGEEGEGEDQGKPDPNEPKWKSQPTSEAQKRYIKKLGGNPDAPKTKGQASDLIEKLLKGEDTEEEESTGFGNNDKEDKIEDELNDATRSDLNQINSDHSEGCDPNVDFENDSVEKQQEEGEKEIEKIEDKISEMLQDNTQVKKYDIQENIKHQTARCIDNQTLPKPSRVDYDRTTVNRLKQLFKRIKSKQTQELSDSGTDIDVDLYIKNQVEGGHEFLLNDSEQKGFAVVIGVDESGSMDWGGRMDSARSLCATLYKAFDGMPNVDIYVFGWTTGTDENTGKHGVLIKKITKFEDVGSLQSTGGTPFLEATYYLADFVEKLPHRRKLMFQITDGDVYHDEALGKYFNKLRKSKIEITGIQIADCKSQSMIDLFGKENYIQTSSIDKIKGAVTKNIVGKFMRCMN